ncbi:helix-turn-helix domain-containing protein [Methylorubrum populi]|uniref:Helix-turn-helix domain-containing protein n=1 Tax=Methylorubrum populi TaxID=223967 RepID=A0A833J674_9HYPH|nr:helix-turn-helix domain-containing protein [Methylorubrum populi]KAB7785380.1 hypothetical protein F8B43_1881 [Methylorubrum populi]
MTLRMPPPGGAKLTTRETAHRLGVSPSYLNRARAGGYGPVAHRYGRKIVYLASDVAAYAAAHRLEPIAADASTASPSNTIEGGRS